MFAGPGVGGIANSRGTRATLFWRGRACPYPSE